MLGRKKAQEVSKPASAKEPKKKTKTLPSTPKENTRDQSSISKTIEEYAYFLWEKEGRPEGRDREFWLKAERELLTKILKE